MNLEEIEEWAQHLDRYTAAYDLAQDAKERIDFLIAKVRQLKDVGT